MQALRLGNEKQGGVGGLALEEKEEKKNKCRSDFWGKEGVGGWGRAGCLPPRRRSGSLLHFPCRLLSSRSSLRRLCWVKRELKG